MIRIFSTSTGLVIERDGTFSAPTTSIGFDQIFRAADPAAFVRDALAKLSTGSSKTAPEKLEAPLQSQEIWAAGVTYLRSRTARMEESKDAGGGTFYDKVYEADRPELFFKGTPHRVAAPGTGVKIRGDAKWNVPEPELTLAINSAGKIFGYTVGNDMSSRDIEGENPLYLPQAKVYDRSSAIGPCLVITDTLPGPDTVIAIEIKRGGAVAFAGKTAISQIKRSLPSLASWLYRDNSFPNGCYLMTGTGIVPEDSFTLKSGDEIRITIGAAGTLVNSVI